MLKSDSYIKIKVYTAMFYQMYRNLGQHLHEQNQHVYVLAKHTESQS